MTGILLLCTIEYFDEKELLAQKIHYREPFARLDCHPKMISCPDPQEAMTPTSLSPKFDSLYLRSLWPLNEYVRSSMNSCCGTVELERASFGNQLSKLYCIFDDTFPIEICLLGQLSTLDELRCYEGGSEWKKAKAVYLMCNMRKLM